MKKTENFIQSLFPFIFSTIQANANEHAIQKDVSLEFVYNEKEYKEACLKNFDKKLHPEILQTIPLYEAQGPAAWTFPAVYEIILNMNNFGNKHPKTVINHLCHELWHIMFFNYQNYPKITESMYRLTKSGFIKLYRRMHLSDVHLPKFMKYFYSNHEFWAYMFSETCIYGPKAFIGYEYIQKEFNINTRKIYKSIYEKILGPLEEFEKMTKEEKIQYAQKVNAKKGNGTPDTFHQ